MAIAKSRYQREVEALFEGGRLRKYAKNQLIHYAGDSLTHFYYVKEGHLKVYTILDSGDTRTILLLSPGDIFPMAFSITMDLADYHIKYFYQTLTDVTLQVVERDFFKDEVENDPKMMQAYIAYLAASNQAVTNQLEVMKNKKAINKLEYLLSYLVLKLGERVLPNSYKLKIKLSHQEIADLSGVTRETTTALIKKLQKKGAIEQSKGRWIIHTNKKDDGPFEEE